MDRRTRERKPQLGCEIIWVNTTIGDACRGNFIPFASESNEGCGRWSWTKFAYRARPIRMASSFLPGGRFARKHFTALVQSGLGLSIELGINPGKKKWYNWPERRGLEGRQLIFGQQIFLGKVCWERIQRKQLLLVGSNSLESETYRWMHMCGRWSLILVVVWKERTRSVTTVKTFAKVQRLVCIWILCVMRIELALRVRWRYC